ncbi:LuxR C-terminal-related transcriptional regulator [Pedobacter aquatilis]|uniref:LuxR C-terminal-related transcriptional regulator n=1 Tax=Pedobacter aquatilis TaxID=351343 RepID=UPI003977885C
MLYTVFNLNERKHKILQLIADGLKSDVIAEIMSSSHRTIEGTRNILIDSFGAKNTAHLIALAFRYGVLK